MSQKLIFFLDDLSKSLFLFLSQIQLWSELQYFCVELVSEGQGLLDGLLQIIIQLFISIHKFSVFLVHNDSQLVYLDVSVFQQFFPALLLMVQ